MEGEIPGALLPPTATLRVPTSRCQPAAFASWALREFGLSGAVRSVAVRCVGRGVLMRVSVMQIRIVPVSVHEPFVDVRMHMRFASIPGERMRVPVMLVMDMAVLVLHRLVDVLVAVAFRQVQIEAQGHQRGRADHPQGDRF